MIVQVDRRLVFSVHIYGSYTLQSDVWPAILQAQTSQRFDFERRGCMLSLKGSTEHDGILHS